MKTLSIIDLAMILVPILIFVLHVKKGPDIRVFGYNDGIGLGLLLLAPLYTTGVIALLVESRLIGYPTILLSFIVRPLWFAITQKAATAPRKKTATLLLHAYHEPFPPSKRWNTTPREG